MKTFEIPELEIIEIKVEDIVTTSGNNEEGTGRPDEFPIG